MWIDEFFELLYSGDSKKIEKAYALKNKKIPNFLYKYKSIKDDGYTFDLLENDLAFLSNANNLNDLYEGEFFFDDQELFFNRFEANSIPYFLKITNFDNDKKKRIKNAENPYLEIIQLIYETDSNINKNISLNEFNDTLFNLFLDTFGHTFKKGNVMSKENTYLTCFSENHDLILMWSYYTDSNK